MHSILNLIALYCVVLVRMIAAHEEGYIIAAADEKGDPLKAELATVTRIATIVYSYNCPVGGADSRTIKIRTILNGVASRYENVENAETLTRAVYENLGGQRETVAGTFTHRMCLPRAAGRQCFYEMSASLLINIDGPNRALSWSIPARGRNVVAPLVRESCTSGGATTCVRNRWQNCQIGQVRVLGFP